MKMGLRESNVRRWGANRQRRPCPLSERWYERAAPSAAVGMAVGLGVETFFWIVWGVWAPWPVMLLAATAYLTAFTYDVAATHRHVGLKAEFDKRGWVMPTCEGNPLLPAFPSLRQQVLSLATLMSILLVPLIVFVPGIGAGAAVLHGLAAAANKRAYQRARQVLWSGDTVIARAFDK